MRSSYSLGRIAGIEIGLNWSVLALLALLMWTLATSIFPSTNPGLSDNTYFAMAVVAAFLFFLSILLHELGHAFQARREGLEIDGITLWLFGGVARFSGMFPTAGAEFRIAVAGPLVSLVLGGAFVGGALIPSLPSAADGVCAWLGFTNLALLAFNLIPALPLDGGRMLRAALWAWKGDLRGATRLAAGVGRVLALAMIGAGIAMTILLGVATGIWLAFIGWFVLQANTAEARWVEAAGPRVLRVRDMMERDGVVLRPDQTIAEFVAGLWQGRHEWYAVAEDGHPVGLFPLRALERLGREEWETRTVGEFVVRAAVPELREDDELGAALQALQGTELGRALVLDEGDRLVGVLSTGDVARALRPDAEPTVPA
jgi:Zn-dependent protease/predicted transcriptional regulator